MNVTIIAEVGLMHDGGMGNALRLIDTAAELGADAVKFQTHFAEYEILPNAPSPPYFTSESRYDYFRRTAFTEEQWKMLRKHAEAKHLQFISSAFAIESLDLLNRIGVTALKVPSGEVNDLPFLERVAKSQRPIYLSSGMSNWADLDQAVKICRSGGSEVTLMQCTSIQPCPYEKVGLNVIEEMRQRYKIPVGMSDHTATNYAAFAAVGMGVVAIEKHLVMSRRLYGSDAKHSLEPDEFADLVHGIRAISMMLNSPVDKDDLSALGDIKRLFEKSIVSLADLPAGAIFSPRNVGCRKPAGGIPAARWNELMGKRSKRPVPAGKPLTDDDVDWSANLTPQAGK